MNRGTIVNKKPYKTATNLRTDLLHLSVAIPTNGHQTAAVVTGQRYGFVDAATAEDVTTLPAVVLLFADLIERNRTRGTIGHASQRFPLDRNRGKFLRKLVIC